MSADWFVDTNVLLYARDSTEIDKQRRADDWLRWLWSSRSGALSIQVIQEYYVSVTRKLRRPIPLVEARRHVDALMTWKPIGVDAQVLRAAWHTEDRFGLSWWDSLVVGAARVAGCGRLLTEDLQDGQDLDGVLVVDPFQHAPPA